MMLDLSTLLGAFGLSASAGLNAYIPLLIVAISARFFPQLVHLQSPYDVVASWPVIGMLTLLLVVEVLADKVPIIDHINDFFAMFIRPFAGALLFAATTGAVTDLDPRAALILGFLVAGSTHTAKATARPIITATTGGLGNPVISLLEDVVALITSLIAIMAPLFIGLAMIFLVLFFIWWRARRPQRPRPIAV